MTALRTDRFLRALRREPVDVTPVWMMRQAGRSLPEYRLLREKYRLVDIVAQADLCAEVTLQPVRRFDVDAAVMFADIMLPLKALGIEFELVDDVGPVIARPIRSAADVDALERSTAAEAVPQVMTAVREVVSQSPVPVICFSGGPFTLASYIIEGRPSREFKFTKAFMYAEPEAFDRLLRMLSELAVDYLGEQLACGASAFQVFDSWVGALAPADYRDRVLPHTQAIFNGVLARSSAPGIHFATACAGLLPQIAATGCSAVSLDWRVDLDQGWDLVGHDLAVQGNLDPSVLLGPATVVRDRAQSVLQQAAGRHGHVFNLGHGVLPETPLENLEMLVETVHAWRP